MIIVGAIYLAGVLVGLLRTDARGPARVILPLLWPLGPIAFAVTATMLLAAAVIAFTPVPWLSSRARSDT